MLNLWDRKSARQLISEERKNCEEMITSLEGVVKITKNEIAKREKSISNLSANSKPSTKIQQMRSIENQRLAANRRHLQQKEAEIECLKEKIKRMDEYLDAKYPVAMPPSYGDTNTTPLLLRPGN